VRYRKRLDTKFGDLLRLHSFSVVAVGFERLVSAPRLRPSAPLRDTGTEAEPRLVSDDVASPDHGVA